MPNNLLWFKILKIKIPTLLLPSSLFHFIIIIFIILISNSNGHTITIIIITMVTIIITTIVFVPIITTLFFCGPKRGVYKKERNADTPRDPARGILCTLHNNTNL